MAIRKQNQTIWTLAAVVFLMLVIYLFSDGRFREFLSDKTPAAPTAEPETSMENFGDQAGSEAVSLPGLIKGLSQCFQTMEISQPESVPVIDEIFKALEKDWGHPTHQMDRWMHWNLKTPEGRERALRLEITESDTGQIVREISYFEIEIDGTKTVLPLSSEQMQNPTDEVITELLRDGTVFSKERAAVAFFQNTNRIEYIERGEGLTEMNVFGGKRQFRCQDVRTPSNCQCLEEGI